MKSKKRLFLGMAGLAVAAVTAIASGVAGSVTLRTTAYFEGIIQATNTVTGHPQYEAVNLTGANLVNLAMGRAATDTSTPNQVLAITFACDLSSASFVVYNTLTSNIVTTIGSSTSINSVTQQDAKAKAPNRARFITTLQLGQNGNGTDGLVGGYLTVSGRVNLNPETGCPAPVVVSFDQDPFDGFDDLGLGGLDNSDRADVSSRTGVGHVIGVVDAVAGGAAATILVHDGGLSFRQELPIVTLNLD